MDDPNLTSFPFLNLLPEIRIMIYEEVFSERKLLLRNCPFYLTGEFSGRSRWPFRIHDLNYKSDSCIALLQTCKQIYSEAQPLLTSFPPSHLILSRHSRRIPRYHHVSHLRDHLGVPIDHITLFSFNVDSLGGKGEGIRLCPGPPPPTPPNLQPFGYTFIPMGPSDNSELPDSSDCRLPTMKFESRLLLNNICRLNTFLSYGLPHLRELHIYNALKHELFVSTEGHHCQCPIAGTKSCTCGECGCTCAFHPPIPFLDKSYNSISGLEDDIRCGLLHRYRGILPEFDDSQARGVSCFYTLLDLLAHGTHIIYHDQVRLSMPEADSTQLIWNTTYHLHSPQTATAPAHIAETSLQSPRQLHLSREQQAKQETSEDKGEDEQPNLRRSYPEFRAISNELKSLPLQVHEAGLQIELWNKPVLDAWFEKHSNLTFSMMATSKRGRLFPSKKLESLDTMLWKWT